MRLHTTLTMFKRLRVAFVLVLLFMAFTSWRPVTANNSYTTAGFHHNEVEDPHWDYQNLTAWPRMCNTGTKQSPISFADVNPTTVEYPKNIGPVNFSKECTFSPEETSLRIVNEVYTLSVRLILSNDAEGIIPSRCTVVDPTNPKSEKYHFISMHFHSPPEHRFPVANPNAELHLLFFRTVSSGVVERMVIAVQLVASAKVNTTSTRALHHIMVEGTLPPKHARTTCTLEESMSLQGLLPERGSYLAYSGSLTTPPCTEGVRFIIMTSPVIISRVALQRLLTALNRSALSNFSSYGNRRPPQPRNGRTIIRYMDRIKHENLSKTEALDLYPEDIGKVLSTKDDNTTEKNTTLEAVDAPPDAQGVWPRPLGGYESIAFSFTSVALLAVAGVMYAIWRRRVGAREGRGQGELDPLSQPHQQYGTNSL